MWLGEDEKEEGEGRRAVIWCWGHASPWACQTLGRVLSGPIGLDGNLPGHTCFPHITTTTERKTFPQFPWNDFPWKHGESVVCRMRLARRREAARSSSASSRGAAKKRGDSHNGPRASALGRGGAVCGPLPQAGAHPRSAGGYGTWRPPSPPPGTLAPCVFLCEEPFFNQKSLNSFLRLHVFSQDFLLPRQSSVSSWSPRGPSSSSCRLSHEERPFRGPVHSLAPPLSPPAPGSYFQGP